MREYPAVVSTAGSGGSNVKRSRTVVLEYFDGPKRRLIRTFTVEIHDRTIKHINEKVNRRSCSAT